MRFRYTFELEVDGELTADDLDAVRTDMESEASSVLCGIRGDSGWVSLRRA